VIVIEYLQAENSMLQERLRGRRLRFSDAERALLARNGESILHGQRFSRRIGKYLPPAIS